MRSDFRAPYATRWPESGFVLNKANPITRGLVSVIDPVSGRELLTGPQPTITGAKNLVGQGGTRARGFGTTYGTASTDIIRTTTNTLSTARTIFLTFFSPGLGAYDRLLQRNDGLSESLQLHGALIYARRVGSTTVSDVTWPSPAFNVAHTCCITSDGVNNAGTFCYIDGVLQTQSAGSEGTYANPAVGDPLLIGNNDAANRVWPGWIGPILQFERVLSQAEAQSLHANSAQIWQAPSRRLYVPAAGAAGISGTASITLDALTAAGTGTLAIKGTSSITLADVTAAGTGTLAIKSTSSITLADVTSTGTGTLAISGTASITLDALTAAGTGTLAIKGAASITLDDVTSSGTGTLTISGTAGITLADVTSTATGTLAIKGASSITLADLTLSGAGVVGSVVTGSASITLDALTAAGTGTLAINSTASITLNDVTAAGTGTLAIKATASIALDDVTVAATGIGPAITGTASITFGALTLVATGAAAVPGVFTDESPRRYTMKIDGARLGFTTDTVTAGRIGSTTATPATKRLGRAT